MTTQKNITSGGHVVAGNLTIYSAGVQTATAETASKLLTALYAKFAEDQQAKISAEHIVESLRAWMPITDHTALERDLQKKLTDAGRVELIKQAQMYKEMFRQKIERYRLFPATQEIYAFLLGHALTRFNSHVLPAINAGAPAAEISELVQTEVVEAIVNLLPSSEPTCDHPSLHGMIFFLTGNCFIDWKPC